MLTVRIMPITLATILAVALLIAIGCYADGDKKPGPNRISQKKLNKALRILSTIDVQI